MTLYAPLIDDLRYKLSSRLKPSFHTHSKYEIYYFHSGKCKYLIGGKTIDLVPGDLIVMNGIREHGPIMDERFTYVRTTVLFDGASSRLLLLHPGSTDVLKPFLLSTHYHWRLDDPLKAEAEEILARINRYYGKNDLVGYNRLRNAFFDMLLFIYERFQETTIDHDKAMPTEKEKIVQKVIAYIEQNYMNELTHDELAGKMHISRFYLMKIFKQLTGLTVFDYINERRINQAKLLFFLDKNSTVTNVCFQVGFKHLSHFSRSFKRIVGLTPEQYRKLL